MDIPQIKKELTPNEIIFLNLLSKEVKINHQIDTSKVLSDMFHFDNTITIKKAATIKLNFQTFLASGISSIQEVFDVLKSLLNKKYEVHLYPIDSNGKKLDITIIASVITTFYIEYTKEGKERKAEDIFYVDLSDYWHIQLLKL